MEIKTMAKVTIQMVDVTSPFLNTSIVEIEDIPMDDNVHRNLVAFLLEAKQPKEEEVEDEKPSIILTGDDYV